MPCSVVTSVWMSAGRPFTAMTSSAAGAAKRGKICAAGQLVPSALDALADAALAADGGALHAGAITNAARLTKIREASRADRACDMSGTLAERAHPPYPRTFFGDPV